MFYFMMIPVTLMSLMMLVHLRRLEKHDRILYRFCDIRRALMKLLRDEGFELRRDDYIAARQLIRALNVTINNYKSRKTVIFNFRRFVFYWKQYERTIRTSSPPQGKDERIKQMQRGAALAMLHAFIAYTPLIRSEILIRLVVDVCRGLGRVGLWKVAGYADKLSEVIHSIREQKQSLGYCN